MNDRIRLIQEIIRAHKVRSQEELARRLTEMGVQTTQATLSRDFKRLKIIKRHDAQEGTYYVLPETDRTTQALLQSDSRTRESIVSIDLSGQLCVVKTLPGCANMVGALIDGHTHPALMGTIAGDDTLLLILRQSYSLADILAFLKSFIPDAEERLINRTD